MQFTTSFKLGLPFLCLFFSFSLSAQTSSFFTYKIRVDEVDFLANHDAPNSKITIYRDYDPHPTIIGPAWKYPDASKPVAFVSGSQPKVYAKFNLAGCTNEIWAKGDGPDSFDPIVQKLESDGVYNATPISAPFPANKVDFYEPFEIKWYISSSPNGPWVAAGTSLNPLYITYGASPQASISTFHSVIYYGCKYAKQLTDQDQIVDNIFNGAFVKPNEVPTLKRKDSPTKDAMTYWAPELPPMPQLTAFEYFSTEALLKWENGRCQAWANFFYNMLAVQGIASSESLVFYKNPALLFNDYNSDLLSFFGSQASDVGPDPTDPVFYSIFFVNNFDINSNTFYLWDREYLPFNTPTTPITLNNHKVLRYAPKDGAPGQGNPNPMSSFVNHDIVKYKWKYYDPSYGISANSANEWESKALSGFGSAYSLIFRYTILGVQKEARIMWLHQANNPSQQAIINP